MITRVDYKLEDGRIVNTMPEAEASGQKYETRFHEEPHGEVFPKEKTEVELEYENKRREALKKKYPHLYD